MPICIECRYPVSQLYHVSHSSNASNTRTNLSAPPPAPQGIRAKAVETGIGAATSKSLDTGGVGARGRSGKEGVSRGVGGDVRLTQCPRCRRFADKYVEHDFVVLFIDLVLVKPQVRSRLTHRFVISGLILRSDCLQMQPHWRETLQQRLTRHIQNSRRYIAISYLTD